MIALFVSACGTPAAMRGAGRIAGALRGAVGAPAAALGPAVLAAAIALVFSLEKSYKRAALLQLEAKLWDIKKS
jgi:hypothetical protein